jgi:hypothetical protein
VLTKAQKTHLSNPGAPAARLGVVPTDITWEEGGCVSTFKVQRKDRAGQP